VAGARGVPRRAPVRAGFLALGARCGSIFPFAAAQLREDAQLSEAIFRARKPSR